MKSRKEREEHERAKRLITLARYRCALLRIRMIKSALERNGYAENNVPALAKQLLFYSAPSWFAQSERSAIENTVALARKCIAAAFSNADVQRAIERRLMTVTEIYRHTPIALEFEHAASVSDLGTCVSCSGTKNSFGRCIGLSPLDVETPCDHERILYLYRRTSPYNRRVEQRAYLKEKLKKHRTLVALAMRNSKSEFIRDHGATAEIIERTFRMPLGQFWRVARGKEFIEFPNWPVQLLLPFE
ncbi:MAG: hypothetical protein PHS53_00330 [Candidatus Pacebacteria bacterium]|nr:hypothetical protein [Candidatus Paceibacterota bacterium]